MSTEANGRARSPTPRHAPLLLPLLHSEWRRGLGRGGTPLPSRDRSRGNEPPLPCPLLPQREERGKMRVPGRVLGGEPELNGQHGGKRKSTEPNSQARPASSPSPLQKGRGVPCSRAGTAVTASPLPGQGGLSQHKFPPGRTRRGLPGRGICTCRCLTGPQ